MGPHKPSNSKKPAASASNKSHKPGKKRGKHDHDTSHNHTPGVQKIKGSIRQTKRLLAKDTLAADVRVETERRLKALEVDLEEALKNRKEKTLATRYHKVKFFERKKVLRKIVQTKASLSNAVGFEKSALESELFEHRVDLNYVLHYPKSKKYISLFPPQVRGAATSSADATEEDTAGETAKEREEVRQWVRTQMEEGGLPAEPEVELLAEAGSSSKSRAAATMSKSTTATAWKGSKSQAAEEDDDEEMEEGSEADSIAEDEFFE